MPSREACSAVANCDTSSGRRRDSPPWSSARWSRSSASWRCETSTRRPRRSAPRSRTASAHATQSGLPLQRLRKEAAYHRLLHRLQRAAPDSWAIKGGFALILRLGEQARATRDVDANWRATAASLEEALSIVGEMDDGDWFTFPIGDARPRQPAGAAGAYRYAVTATLDGRVFEQLILDVNVVGEHDPPARSRS